MGTYEKKVNQLKDLMVRKYKSAYNKSKEMDIDISSMTYLPKPDAFNVINIEKMHIILDKVNKIIDDNKDKLKNPTCATCIHLHDQEWAKRYGKVCCYAKELQPYKGMGLCSECGRLATSPDGRDVVVPGKWHGKFPKEKATEEQLKHVGYKNLIR